MRRWIASLMVLMCCLLVIPTALANEAKTESPRIQIEEHARTFDPKKTGDQLEKKGFELIGLAKSGSVLYMAIALILFIVLLIGGLVYKPLVKAAFFVLFIAGIGFIVLNYWPEIVEIGKAVGAWLMKGGETSEIAPGA